MLFWSKTNQAIIILMLTRCKCAFSISCSSKIGKKYAEPGSQKVSIGDGCNFVGTIIHELMHAIGKLVDSYNSMESLYLTCNMTAMTMTMLIMIMMIMIMMMMMMMIMIMMMMMMMTTTF